MRQRPDPLSRTSTVRAGAITSHGRASREAVSRRSSSSLGRQPSEQVRSLVRAHAAGGGRRVVSNVNRPSRCDHTTTNQQARITAGLGRQPSEQVRSQGTDIFVFDLGTPRPRATYSLGRQPSEQVRSQATRDAYAMERRVSDVNRPSVRAGAITRAVHRPRRDVPVSDVNRPSRCDHTRPVTRCANARTERPAPRLGRQPSEQVRSRSAAS